MNKKFLTAVMVLLMPMMAGAQALKGSYFLDNSLNSNKLNPAFAPNTGYFMIPAIGNLNLGLYSNLEVQTFMYPMNGQVYTFLNNNVSLEQFEKALPRHPHFDVAADMNLINFGFFTGRSFWTFDMGLRINADVDIPRDLFTFMKKGSTSDGFYNIGAMKVNAAASVQASLGWSRDFGNLVPGLRFGARARAILPIAYAGLNFENVSLTTSADKWTVNTDGSLHTAMQGLTLKDSGGLPSPSFDATKIGFAGWGFSFDLGAEYRMKFDGFINGVNFSAAVTDLGMIEYRADAVCAYKTNNSMDWTGVSNALETGAVENALKDLEGEFKKLLDVSRVEKSNDLMKSTLPSFYVGVEMPFCKNKMSIGALYSARKSYYYTRNEITLSYNLNPVKWFELGLNYSFLNVSRSMGFVLELTPRVGPCLYLGLDYIPMEFVKVPDGLVLPYIPTSERLNFHFGLAFSLGGKNKKAEPAVSEVNKKSGKRHADSASQNEQKTN